MVLPSPNIPSCQADCRCLGTTHHSTNPFKIQWHMYLCLLCRLYHTPCPPCRSLPSESLFPYAFPPEFPPSPLPHPFGYGTMLAAFCSGVLSGQARVGWPFLLQFQRMMSGLILLPTSSIAGMHREHISISSCAWFPSAAWTAPLSIGLDPHPSARCSIFSFMRSFCQIIPPGFTNSLLV